jgi:type VI secretion system protein ImpB
MDDFEPEQVARQVRPLRELLDLRTKLSDLRGALQTNEKLDTVLMEAIGNTEKMGKIKDELKKEKDKGGTDEPA